MVTGFALGFNQRSTARPGAAALHSGARGFFGAYDLRRIANSTSASDRAQQQAIHDDRNGLGTIKKCYT
jgi:hypothetical protein